MNKRQKTVILVGLALIFLMGLFPPWVHLFVYVESEYPAMQFERSAGYSLLFNPPEPGKGQTPEEFSKDINKIITSKPYKQRRDFCALVEDFFSGKTKEKYDKIVDFVKSQPEEDHAKLDRQFAEYKAFRTIPDNRCWTPRIDIVRLLIQWALIIFVISGIFIFVKDENV